MFSQLRGIALELVNLSAFCRQCEVAASTLQASLYGRLAGCSLGGASLRILVLCLEPRDRPEQSQASSNVFVIEDLLLTFIRLQGGPPGFPVAVHFLTVKGVEINH